MIAGIETGGTKVVCAVAQGPRNIVARTTIPTSDPDTTLGAVTDFLERFADGLDAIGLGTFGPVDVDPTSRSHGVLGRTPKPGWSGVRLVDRLRSTHGVPVAVDTDVNAAALAEARWGAGRGIDPVVYLTVGTGVGVGGVSGGRTLRGHRGGHPELGHLLVRRHPDDAFAGTCPFHGDCVEGLSAGPALEQRWGAHAERGAELDPVIAELAGFYLAQLVVAVTYAFVPGCVVLGGGVSRVPGLASRIHAHARDQVAGYLDDHPLNDTASDYVRATGLGGDAGVLGALAMAADLLDR